MGIYGNLWERFWVGGWERGGDGGGNDFILAGARRWSLGLEVGLSIFS